MTRLLMMAGVVACLAPWVRGQTVVYQNDFDGGESAYPGVTVAFVGPQTIESVQGYAGLGNGVDVFAGNLARNEDAAGAHTILGLTNLPPHSSVRLEFLLAVIDSWDGGDDFSGSPAGDIFAVMVDGVVVFRESFSNSGAAPATFAPPPLCALAERQNLGFNPSGGFHLDSAYDFGRVPALASIPHTSPNLAIEWFAGGPGWQGSSAANMDESWGLDALRVSIDGCRCEIDGATPVNVFDLLAYLDLWFAGDAAANVDGAGGVDVFDLLTFLDCWFPASAGAPCA